MIEWKKYMEINPTCYFCLHVIDANQYRVVNRNPYCPSGMPKGSKAHVECIEINLINDAARRTWLDYMENTKLRDTNG